jgi:flagellar protein FliS
MNGGLGAYKKTSVQTASREQILLMLYQSAIKNCKLAINAIESKQIAKKGEFIGKFQDIIIELNNSLDFEVGGDIAQELTVLYDFIIHTSSQANLHMDAKKMQDCLNIVTTLYSGWSEAIKSLK